MDGQTRMMKSKTVTFFLLMFMFWFWQCVVSNNNNEIVGDEAAYLIKLRDAISPAPSNWFNNTNMCDWTRVICGTFADTRNVEEINLNFMSLKGTLPSGLNNSLFYLTRLILYNNSLTGPLPTLAGLVNLREVSVSYNNFTSVPQGCFQSLNSLEELRISYNTNLAPWTFPSSLNDSVRLYFLSLVNTNLVGSLPDAFDSFPALEYLDLSSLTGSLPKSFRKLSKLQWLVLRSRGSYSC